MAKICSARSLSSDPLLPATVVGSHVEVLESKVLEATLQPSREGQVVTVVVLCVCVFKWCESQ